MATTTNIPGYIGLVDAAEIIGVSHSQVWRYISNGLLDAIEIGGTYLVKRSDVRKFKRPAPGRKPRDRASQGDN